MGDPSSGLMAGQVDRRRGLYLWQGQYRIPDPAGRSTVGNRSLSTSGHVVSRGQFVGPAEEEPEMPRTWNVAQITVVLLLVWGAYWAALPWIDCVRGFPAAVRIGESVGYCTLGIPEFGFHGLGWNIVAGALYVAAALWFLRRRP
jgi:hypothetical protein